MTHPSWAAIVVAFSPGPELVRAVDAVLTAGASRVVVWDNSPEPRAAELLGTGMALVDVHGDGVNYGFGAANNLAFEVLADEFEFVFLVNPDCVVDQQTPQQLITALRSNERLAAVAPRMRYPDGAFGIAGGNFPGVAKEIIADSGIDDLLPRSTRRFLLRAWGWRPGRRSNGGYGASFQKSSVSIVDWISGFAIMTRAERFAEAGGFDPDYFLYFEDVDLCWRFRDHGYAVAIVGEAEALHLESVSTGAHGKSAVYNAGRRLYFRNRGGRVDKFVAERLWR